MKKQARINWFTRRYLLSLIAFSLFTFPFSVQAGTPQDGHGHGHSEDDVVTVDEAGDEAVTPHDDNHFDPDGDHLGECHVKPDEISDVIMHHVMDSHDWHITDWPTGGGCYTAIALPLPWILYSSETGFTFALTTHKLNHNPKAPYVVDHHGHAHNVTKKELVHDVSVEHAEESDHYVVAGHGSHHEIWKVEHVSEEATVLDFSITKTVFQMLLVALFMIWIFTKVAKAYKKRDGLAPKGLQSFMEPVILFVRDDVGKPFLGDKTERFLPYLLTLFFFIWISNLFGLTPLSSNIAGNTSVTVALALISFIYILRNSTKDFWLHIFWFPGVPVPLKPLMFVVEFMGLLTKPVALAIRLFANISAGHFMVLSLICMIFILGDNGNSVGGAVGIAPMSILFSLFIFAVELIVAAVQAFVFALLTAVFISQAMETHDDHH